MLIDYHIHLKGRYQREFLDKYIENGVNKGIKEFCITEHIHRFKETIDIPNRIIKKFGDNENTNFMKEWWTERCTKTIDEYVNFIHGLKDEGYPVKLGCEVDFLDEPILESIVKDYPWDFIIGSVHWIQGWGFDHLDREWTWQSRDIDLIYKKYFNLIKEAAKSGMFDVIGHFDVIKVFGYYPSGEWSSLVEETLEEIIQNKIGIEVNTAGWRKPIGEIYPGEKILKQCKKYGIHVTLGSDAHQPEEVGYGFDRALMLLDKIGYRFLTIYDKRKDYQIPIEDKANGNI
ncbi:histidinol-phosphatase HisJ family protein [candidate division WOR-3 bacterium]|nr:histidinol-phosphatase HisJ family protein [candidate division WOR-3 bacterium]